MAGFKGRGGCGCSCLDCPDGAPCSVGTTLGCYPSPNGFTCGGVFPVAIVVKGPSGETVAELTQDAGNINTSINFTVYKLGKYTVTWTPNDSTWFGSVTKEYLLGSCAGFSAAASLPFLKDSTHLCGACCGDGFMPRTLYFTDGNGTHVMPYDGDTGPTVNFFEWKADVGCVYDPGSPAGTGQAVLRLAKDPSFTPPLQVLVSVLTGSNPSNWQFSGSWTCKPFAGSWTGSSQDYLWPDGDCNDIFQNVSISE